MRKGEKKLIFLLILIVIILVIMAINVKIVPQSYAYVIERLGVYAATWYQGFHIAVPFIDQISKRINLKEQLVDIPPQPVITKDNVTVQIDAVVYMRITDPKRYVYGMEDPIKALEALTTTSLRNAIGDLDLDEILSSRGEINLRVCSVVDEASDPWGIKVSRCEISSITPPKDIQRAMEKQMVAERERREAILKAEGQKKSAILVAEGEKESKILKAQADKEAEILKAEADKEASIKRSEGRAEAIRRINEAKPSEQYLRIQALKTLKDVAEGEATTIFLPDDLAKVASITACATQTGKDSTRKTNLPK